MNSLTIGILVSVLFIAIIIFFAVAIAVAFVKKEYEKEIKIRQALAKDLHDDLGSCLNNTRLHTFLAEKNNNEIQASIQPIKQSIDTSIQKLKDVVWVLDDNKNSLLDLFTKIKTTYEPLLHQLQIKSLFEFDTQLETTVINKNEKRNVLMICTESINNAIKYAQCSQITFSVLKKNNNVEIMIQDNGIGFCIQEKENSSTSYGLKNMQTRSLEIGYNIVIQSILQQGTVIKVCKK